MLSLIYCSYSRHMLETPFSVWHCRLRSSGHRSCQSVNPFQGHVSLQPHWLCTKTIICILFPEGGGQISGSQYCTLPLLISTVHQGQFIWKHSPGCWTTATPASSIRAQCELGAALRRGKTNTNPGSIWASLQHTAQAWECENLLLLTQIPGTKAPPPLYFLLIDE